MTDITTFLRARLDEEQRKAERGAGGRHDHLDRDNYGFLWADPARVLAQVAAMRAIVGKYESWLDWATDRPDDPYPYAKVSCYKRATLALAAIWCDHDDYDPAWVPDT